MGKLERLLKDKSLDDWLDASLFLLVGETHDCTRDLAKAIETEFEKQEDTEVAIMDYPEGYYLTQEWFFESQKMVKEITSNDDYFSKYIIITDQALYADYFNISIFLYELQGKGINLETLQEHHNLYSHYPLNPKQVRACKAFCNDDNEVHEILDYDVEGSGEIKIYHFEEAERKYMKRSRTLSDLLYLFANNDDL